MFINKKQPMRWLLTLGLTLSLVLGLAGIALAADFRGGDTITIGKDEVIDDDLIITGIHRWFRVLGGKLEGDGFLGGACTILRATAVAINLGISWDWIFHAFKNSPFQLRVVTAKTITGALIIDDTYNASPDSTLAALNLLNDLDGRKVAVLGDMLELGQYEHEGHRRVGLRASEVADEIVLVGERSKITREAVLETDFDKEKLHWFATTDEAIAHLRPSLRKGDIALVKSSHSMHLEVIVSALEEVN